MGPTDRRRCVSYSASPFPSPECRRSTSPEPFQRTFFISAPEKHMSQLPSFTPPSPDADLWLRMTQRPRPNVVIELGFGDDDPVKVCVVLLSQEEALKAQQSAHKKLLARLKQIEVNVPKRDEAIAAHDAVFNGLFWREVLSRAVVYPNANGDGPLMLVEGKWTPRYFIPNPEAIGELTNIAIEQLIEAYGTLADINSIPASEEELNALIERLSRGAHEVDFLVRTLPRNRLSQLLSTLHSRLQTYADASTSLSTQ